jgi:hypothetical protein
MSHNNHQASGGSFEIEPRCYILRNSFPGDGLSWFSK